MSDTEPAISDAPEEDSSEPAASEGESAEETEATEASQDSGDAADGKDADGDAADGEAADGEAADGEAADGEDAADKPAPAKKRPDPTAALTLDRDRLKQQLMRTAADFDNFRRRSRREVEEARMRGKDEAVVELLPVIDNLERAVASVSDATDVESVVSGIKMVLKLFEDTSSRMGLNRVESVGARFDPAMHDAIQHLESDVHPPGSIMAEVTPGYMFGKRLIRPAMVVVARGTVSASTPPPAASSDDEEGADGGAQASAAPSDSQGSTGSSRPPKADGGDDA